MPTRHPRLPLRKRASRLAGDALRRSVSRSGSGGASATGAADEAEPRRNPGRRAGSLPAVQVGPGSRASYVQDLAAQSAASPPVVVSARPDQAQSPSAGSASVVSSGAAAGAAPDDARASSPGIVPVL